MQMTCVTRNIKCCNLVRTTVFDVWNQLSPAEGIISGVWLSYVVCLNGQVMC